MQSPIRLESAHRSSTPHSGTDSPQSSKSARWMLSACRCTPEPGERQALESRRRTRLLHRARNRERGTHAAGRPRGRGVCREREPRPPRPLQHRRGVPGPHILHPRPPRQGGPAFNPILTSQKGFHLGGQPCFSSLPLLLAHYKHAPLQHVVLGLDTTLRAPHGFHGEPQCQSRSISCQLFHQAFR